MPKPIRDLRRHRHRRRPCRHRGGAGGRPHGRAHAAAHPEHRDAGADELQPGDRRHRQGTPGARDRCARRRHGARRRSRRHPVPDPECQQGPGGARHARPGRPAALPAGHPRAAWRTSRTSGCFSRRSADLSSRAAGAGRGHRHRHRLRGAAPWCSPWAPSSAAASTSASTTTRAGAPGMPPSNRLAARLRELPLRVGAAEDRHAAAHRWPHLD